MDLLSIPPLPSRAPISPLLASAPSLLLLLLFLLPQSRLTTLALLPPLIILALHAPLAYTTGDAAADFGLASASFQRVLVALDRFVWTEGSVEEVYAKEGENVKGWRRLWWATENTMLQRGVARRWEVANVPSSGRDLPRWKFVVTLSLRAVVTYATFDILSAYMQRHPYFKRRLSFAELHFAEKQLTSLCAGAASSIALFLVYDIICAVTVALGIWTAEESPDLFGSPRGITSLQRFWGTFWHQCFRRPFTTSSLTLLRLLRIPPSSQLARIICLLVPFILSAAQHSFGMYAMHRTGWNTAKFFLVQPVGILLERGVGKAARGMGWKGGAGLLGFVWVAGWLLATGPWFFDDLVQGGMWEVKPPFSATEWVLERVKKM